MKLQISIDGKQYEADIEVLEEERHESAALAQTRSATKRTSHGMGPTEQAFVPTAGVSDAKACKSTIVGIVVTVLVKVGEDVAAGQPLLVLEAMKMESNVVSPVAGRIKAVCVAAGESVKKGQVLIEFE